MKAEIVKEVDKADWLCFTTDIWSTDISNESLLSFTTHWLSESFEKKSAILCAQKLSESHTGEYIFSQCRATFIHWKSSDDRIHAIIGDNASNMIKAFDHGNLSSIGCFANTLQLIVHDGVLSQRGVNEILTICRKIVGHCKRSSLVCSCLKKKINLGLPVHHLQQDEPTRWNSSLYMLKRIREQKMAIAPYRSEYSLPVLLTNHKLDLINKIIAVLSPAEELTQSISTDAASISLIIPFIRNFERI